MFGVPMFFWEVSCPCQLNACKASQCFVILLLLVPALGFVPHADMSFNVVDAALRCAGLWEP